MACSIVSVVGVGGDPPTDLRITYEAEGCEALEFRSECIAGDSIQVPVPSAEPQQYTTDVPAKGCECGDQTRVEMSCVPGAGGPCEDSWSGTLACSECPTVTFDPPPEEGEECQNGKRPVTLSAKVTAPSSQQAVCQWIFDADAPPVYGPAFTVPAGSTVTNQQTHDYVPPGPYTAKIDVLSPSGCADAEVQVGPLQECPPECPTASVQVAGVGACEGGTREVTLQADVTAPSGSDAVGHWDFGDGTLGETVFVPAGTTQQVTTSHEYDPGESYTARIVWNEDAYPDCPPAEVTVGSLDPCPTECPEIDAVTIDVSRDCNQDDTRTVTADAVVSGGSVATYHWEWGDGESETHSGPVQPRAHDYPAPGNTPSTYTATLTVTDNAGCVDTFVQTIEVPGCEGDCPSIVDVAVEPGGCLSDGRRRTVNFDATVSGSPTEFEWQFGDGHSEVVQVADTGGDPATSHVYDAPGTYTATLILRGPGGCEERREFTVVVEECPCPDLDDLAVERGRCSDDGGTREMTLSASIDGTGVEEYVWEFGDGESATTTDPTVTHDYDAPGSYTATVTVRTREGCDDLTRRVEVEVPTCETVNGPVEPFWCFALRAVFVVLSIIAILVAYAALCIPTLPGGPLVWGLVAAGLALVAAGLFALWFFLCPDKPCGWGLLLGWQILLGAGIGALYFALCCPVMWLVGPILIVFAAVAFVAWSRQCRVGRCRQLAELSIVLSGVILPVIAWIAGVPFLAACMPPPVGMAVSLLAAVVALGVAYCATQAPG